MTHCATLSSHSRTVGQAGGSSRVAEGHVGLNKPCTTTDLPRRTSVNTSEGRAQE